MGNEFKWLPKEGSWYSRLQKSCNTQAEQWKNHNRFTTYESDYLSHLDLSVQTQLWFSMVQLASCKVFAICCIYLQPDFKPLCADAVILQCIFCHALAYTIAQNYAHIIWMSNLVCFPCG